MRPLALLCLFLLMTTTAVDAQVIHRCRGADGSTVFADRACEFVDAVPIAPPEPIDNGAEGGGPRPSPLAVPAEAGGCPAPTLTALLERVEAALRSHDINGLAGLYDWAGAGQREAARVLADMQRLIDAQPRPRLETPEWAVNALPQHRPLPRLAFYSSQDAFYPQASYRLTHNAGCVWLAN